MDDKYRSRKFALALTALLVASAALLMGNMSGAEYSACIAFILGLYGAANVMEKRNVQNPPV